jgi:DNA uptake protein ComE-like DNA-binding protein
MKNARVVLRAVAARALAAAMAWAADPANPAPAPTAGSPASMKPAATAKATSTSHATEAKPAHHSGSASKSSHHAMTDLNSASKEALMKLPGITDATADKIIDARPYKSRDELVSKNIVTKEEFGKIKEQVTAKPAPQSASK